MKQNMRRIIPALVFTVIITTTAGAEFVFKTDGSIIEGRITTDTKDSIVIRNSKGESITVRRSNIMRILYTNIYLGKVYIRMTTGNVKEGYIVDEDRDSYKFRQDLYKPIEEIIPRSKVMFIARGNPTDLAGTPGKYYISIKWSPPFITPMRYKVYILKPGEKEFSFVNQTQDTTLTITGLKSNTKYAIYVTAIDKEGIESLPSDKLELYTLNDPPTQPDNLTMSDSDKKGGKSIILKWDESTDSDGKIQGYRVLTRKKGEEIKDSGTVKKTEYELKGAAIIEMREVRIYALDDLNAESDELVWRDVNFHCRLRPAMMFPFGAMGDLWSYGAGTYAGFFVTDFLVPGLQLGAETGYFYWAGKQDVIDKMQMVPVLASFGYRFDFTESFTASLLLNAGGVFMSTDYTDAAMQDATESAFEPLFSGSLFVEYYITENFYIMAGGEFSVIYESSGIQKFAGASIGAGYRFY